MYFGRYEFICFERYHFINFEKSMVRWSRKVGEYKRRLACVLQELSLNVIPDFLQRSKDELKVMLIFQVLFCMTGNYKFVWKTLSASFKIQDPSILINSQKINRNWLPAQICSHDFTQINVSYLNCTNMENIFIKRIFITEHFSRDIVCFMMSGQSLIIQ